MDHPIHANAEPIPGYRLIERLGRGGYGEVWKAEAPGGMHKAIKFVAGDVDGLGDDGKAAEQEYKSLSRVKTIRHPFILSLERFEVIDGQLTIVMELADRNLWDRYTECVRHGLTGIPRPELLRYLEEASEALDLMNLHHQIQHLDVKPHNIFLVHQHVKVADFGLAKDLEGTRADLTGGVTPTYAPPETFDGWVSRQSDQYSLAIVYMEMLTGRRPFNGSNTRQLILQHLTATPDLSPLSGADRDAVARALSKTPADRFPTCADFVRAIRGDERRAELRTPTPVDVPADPPETDGPRFQTHATPLTLRRSVPALVTPTLKQAPASGPSRERRRSRADAGPPAPSGPEPERTGEGVLYPALLVGVGHVGLWILRTLRQLVAERFGTPTLPHLRWLYVDTDPAGAEDAVAGPETAALAVEDILITRLRRPAHYLSRDGLPAVDSWLPPEELFRMPRTPATEGSRGLGRLALCDHYHVVRHRLRTALEPFMRPAHVDEAHRVTGLSIRSTWPRVYLAASLAGGTGSGMFLDLGYLIRRIARQIGFEHPQVTGVLAVPTAGTTTADQHGLANARAALTELHHYGCAGTGYQVQFDTREGAFEDPDRPFHRCVMVPVPGRFDPSGSARSVEVAAHTMFAELLTQIGRSAHPDGDNPTGCTYVVAGLRRMAWPRAGVVRAAAWLLARRTLQNWASKTTAEPSATVDEIVESVWADHRFDRSAVHSLLERRATDVLGGSPADLVELRLQPSAHGSRSGSSDGHSLRAALRGLIDLLGRPGQDDSDHPHELGRLLADLVRDTAARADAGLEAAVLSLVDRPDVRVGGAEDAIRVFRQRLTEELAWADREAADFEEQSLALFVSLHHQHPASAGGAPAPGPLADTLPAVREWAEVRTRALFARACASVYRIILGNLPDKVRELSAIRHQLAALIAQLDADPPALPTAGGVVRPIFPNMDCSAAEAAAQFVTELSSDQVREFEDALQARVRNEFQGICAVCSRPREAGRAFLNALVDQASRFVDVRTAHQTVTEVLAAHARAGDGLRDWVAELIATAAPATLVGSGLPAVATLTVLGAPADDTSTRLAELVRSFTPGGTFRTATTECDIVLYQEAPVHLTGLPCWTSERANGPGPENPRPATAHARMDVAWAPVGVD